MITLDDVRTAAARIAPHVHRTPVLTSRTLDGELGCKVFVKCENLQKVGAFKARGAVNAVLSLSDAQAGAGVVTHSSGNHGAALAYAASIRRIPCVVVMPDNAPAVKITAIRGYGAEIVQCPQAEREATCARLQQERAMTLVHPYEDPAVMAGQGTAALELLADVPDLDLVVVPVGGGGLCAGTAVTVAGLRPAARVLAAEPRAVDDAARSMATGVLQPRVESPQTLCDGLLTALGAPNFEVLRRHGVRVVTVTEEAIAEACRFFLERMKIAVEPSGATVLAALRATAGEHKGRRIGAIVSGGNTDFRWLQR